MLLWLTAANAQTYSDEAHYGVEYLIGNNKTLTISTNNASLFKESEVDIVIPATLTIDGEEYTVTGMQSDAFKASKISSVTFECSLTAISGHAFENCKNLRKVILPDNLKMIEGYAFSGCDNLEMPDLPDGFQSTGLCAFSGCGNLGKLTLPSSITNLGSQTFRGSTITEIIWPETLDGSLTISDFCFAGPMLDNAVLEIPEYIDKIPHSCFIGANFRKADLSKMPQGSSIAPLAFQNCPKLEEIVFPDNLTSIGGSAFSTCNSLTTISHWPKNRVATLGNSIFEFCRNLKAVSLPDWMTEIPERTFFQCNQLTDISFVNCDRVMKKIGNEAFRYCGTLASVTLPSALEEIEQNAFRETGLTAIEFPSALKKLGENSFAFNRRLNEIVFSEYIDETQTSFDKNIFENCTGLQSFTMPGWMTTVPEGFFLNCNSLSTIINYNAINVGKSAFDGCLRLKSSDGLLPARIKSVGERAFALCGSSLPTDEYFLEQLNIDGSVTMSDNAFDGAKIKSVALTTCDKTFLDDKSKFGVDVLANITTISSVSFDDCITKIPDGFCKGWSSLETVKWPAALEEIGNAAFNGCPKLELGIIDFTDPDSRWSRVRTYGNFSLCNTGITQVIWPADNSDSFIFGDGLFASNPVRKVNIPSWMNKIPASLFYDCSEADEIIWEQTRNNEPIEVGAYAFGGLMSLESITLPDVEVNLGDHAFYNTSKATFSWPQKTMRLADSAFEGCNGLNFEDFPSYVTEIPDSCFRNCGGLVNLNIGKQIERIGEQAFRKATGLRKVNVLCSLENVPTMLFCDCSSLESVTFAENVSAFDESAFQNCTHLKEFHWSEKQGDFTTIAANVFRNCTSLVEFREHIGSNTEFPTTRFQADQYSGSTALRAVSIPAVKSSITAVANCVSLQAVDYKSDGTVAFDTPTPNVPLLGVSTQPVELTSSPIHQNIRFGGTPAERDKKGVLIVARGDRWKYEEVQFGKVWDIYEYREAKTDIFGTIHSTFDKDADRNLYKSYLSWEVNLSDLNPEGETVYTLWRRGNTDSKEVEVATLRIDKPVLVSDVNDLNVVTSDELIAAKIQVRRPGSDVFEDKKSLYIDFDFETAPDFYEMKSSNQHGYLYFNPETSRRVGTSTAMGTESRLLYIDEFNSPKLDGSEGRVPDYYEYYVTASAFDYDEPVNNDNWETGDDGYAYHFVRKHRDAFTSEKYRVYTPMAIPSLRFNGVYTTDEVTGDTDGSLRESNQFDDKGNITLDYSFHPDVIRHQEETNLGTKYVVQKITCNQVDGNTQTELLSQSVNHDSPDGSITTNSIKPNTTFRLITETYGRGTFGSRAVHLYGAPSLEMSAESFRSVEGPHNHVDNVINCDLKLTPTVEIMGYTGTTKLDSRNHFVGIWRKTTVSSPESSDTQTYTADEETAVFHCNGPVEENFINDCETCSNARGYKIDESAMTYTDVLPAPQLSEQKLAAEYRARIYVQLPDDPDHWMIAEAKANPTYDPTNSLDFIDADCENALYYDLQGIRIVNPRPGEILIMVTPHGSRKVKF